MKKNTENINQQKKSLPHHTECICPNCGHQEAYHPTTPCYLRICPKCETPLTQR